MLSNYYTLRYLASTIRAGIKGQRITAAFSQSKDELVLGFDGTCPHLVVSLRQGEFTCFFHPRYTRARSNTADVMGECIGKSVDELTISPTDRVLHFSLSGALRLVVQIYGPKSNVLVVDAGNNILNSFKRGKALVGQAYEPQVGDPTLAFHRFATSLSAQPSTPIAIVARQVFPLLGTTVVREILFRCAIPSTAMGIEITHEDLHCFESVLAGIIQELDSPIPRIYTDRNGEPSVFSIIPLRHLGDAGERTYEDIHAAVRDFVHKRRARSTLDGSRKSVSTALRKQIEKARRTMAAIEQEKIAAQRNEQYEQYASMLMANLGAVRKGSPEVSLPSGDREIVVPLDVRLTPMQNAQKYFNKAKHARAGQQEASRRLKWLAQRIEEGERLLKEVEHAQTGEGLRNVMHIHEGALEAFGIGSKSAERADLPFRIFTVDGGFEVWAGKNSSNNDLLTMKFARPRDLWFHARGSGGSHVVLRVSSASGEPGKRAREQAAAIAAYYSKMKNAKVVPVAMTERKYVRKPRGATPGTVVLDREKVLFVEPALPRFTGETGGEHK